LRADKVFAKHLRRAREYGERALTLRVDDPAKK